jgi:hypothetical protein
MPRSTGHLGATHEQKKSRRPGCGDCCSALAWPCFGSSLFRCGLPCRTVRHSCSNIWANAADYLRHDRCVRNSQSLDAEHAQPCIADHGSIRRAQENSEQLAVVDPGRFDVEPMQTVLKRSNVLLSRLGFEFDVCGRASFILGNIYTVQST